MSFMEAVKSGLGKYATFSGRASRSEFWWFMLFGWIGSIVLSIVDSTLFGTIVTTPNGFSASTNTPILSGLFMLALLLPNWAVAVRRFHDTDRSGWWILIVLIPLIGFILYIVWQATKGTDGENRFGHDPLGGSGGGGRGQDYSGEDFSRTRVPDVGN